MKLYGSLVSPYVARVVLATRLKGLALTPEAPPGGLKSADYLRINPVGKMPAMEVAGRGLGESMVMLDYLEDAHPTPALLPAAPLDRAQVRLLGRIVDLYVMPVGRTFFMNLNPAQRKAEEIGKGRDEYVKALGYVEHYLGEGPFAWDARPGYADCAILPCLHMMTLIATACGVNDAYAGLPRLSRWWAHVQKDPATAGFVGEYQTAFEGFLNSRR